MKSLFRFAHHLQITLKAVGMTVQDHSQSGCCFKSVGSMDA